MAATAPAEALDPAALQALLDGRYREVREQLREVLCREEFAPVLALPTDEYRERVLGWARDLAAAGLTAPGFPSAYGGRDDPGANVASFETLAFGDLSLLVKFGVQFGLWGGAVHQLGTAGHHERLLADTASLALPGCFAMTESGHGSDVQGLRTTATYDAASGEFVIDTPDDDARKDYIGNAACHGRIAAVFAQLIVAGENHGVHALVVPLRDEAGHVLPGVRIEDCGEKMGLNGVDNGRIWFDGVRVPREALLNRYGDVDADGRYTSPIENPNHRFFTMLGTLVQGRVCVSGASVSVAKSALTIAIRYSLRRHQFGAEGGRPVAIIEYRTQQRRLMPLLARTYALHFAQARLSERFHAVFSEPEAPERERRELESLAAGMKAMASWHATETVQSARECCGGAGYLAVNRFAALKADSDIFTTFEGDNTVLMLLAAKGQLTDFKDSFGELDPRGLVTFVASQAVETVVERLFARKIAQVIGDWVSIGDEESHLLDHDYHLELFRWREAHITAAAAQRFKRGLDDGHDPFDVFRAVQDHAVDAARAHMDTFLLESFVAAIEDCPTPSVAEALKPVCDLFALHNLEAGRGFFQEHGRLSGPRTKAITREVNRLCDEVRQAADPLVDAFGIPDPILAAPIGLRADLPAETVTPASR